MREIITLFSFLPFTNVGASILPITSENFYLFFIAFIATFFLLGFIIGYILNPHRKSNKTKEIPFIDTAKTEREAPGDTGQGYPMNESEPQRRMDNRYQRYDSNYNDNWDYSHPTRDTDQRPRYR